MGQQTAQANKVYLRNHDRDAEDDFKIIFYIFF